jgi:RNA polymerase sigma-70 factor, ECF subfamily
MKQFRSPSEHGGTVSSRSPIRRHRVPRGQDDDAAANSLPKPGVTPADEAAAQLFRLYGDRVFRLGLGMCGRPENADDLVQETFFRALRAWPSFEGRAKVSTWLYTIASRACRRMERRRAGEPRVLDRYPDGDAERGRDPYSGARPADALDQLTQDQARTHVRQAVAALPATFRLPLLLKDLEGLSVAEVAEVLNLKPGTVKTRVHRARLMLGRALGAGDPPAVSDGDHARRECLDLIQARQDAYDRGVPFPLRPEVVCERCQSLFLALHLTRSACDAMAAGRMPDPLRAALQDSLAR